MFFITTVLFAKIADEDFIKKNRYSLQIAAFPLTYDIQKIEKLFPFDTILLQPIQNYNVVYIINLNNFQEAKLKQKKMKKRFPDTLIITNIKKRITKAQPKKINDFYSAYQPKRIKEIKKLKKAKPKKDPNPTKSNDIY